MVHNSNGGEVSVEAQHIDPDLIVDASQCSRLERLPVEIAQMILEKLPLSSLIRCNLLSKTFSKTMSNLAFELNYDPFLFFKFRDSLYFVRLDHTSRPRNVYKPIKIGIPFKLSSSYIIGSCNGYLCVSNSSSPRNPSERNSYGSSVHVTLISNPFMPQHFMELPSTTMELSWASGFGYSPKTDEHKVVRIYYVRDGASTKQYVQMLTLGTDHHWRTLNSPSGIYIRSRTTIRARGVYLNGWMYWLGERQPITMSCNPSSIRYVILGLDLGNEEFQEIPALDSIVELRGWVYLIRVRGRLALVVIDNSMDELRIWMMEDHGEKPSRRKSEFVIEKFLVKVRDELLIFDAYDPNVTPCDVICFVNNEKLWIHCMRGILCYDFESECFARLKVEEVANIQGNQYEFEAILHHGSLLGIERYDRL